MKKVFSMLIVAVMVFATFAAAIPVAAEAKVDQVNAKYFDVKPVIDGIVSEAEWGAYTVQVNQVDAANIESTSPKNSSFFMRNTAAVPGYDSETLTMSYKLWVRWDEDNFYIAAVVKDPDGHSLKNGRSNTWNGDAFQFKIDPYGYNASSPAGPDNYSPSVGMPWSDYYSNFAFGFVESAGGFTEAWDNLKDVGISSAIGGPCQAYVSPSGAVFSSDTAGGYTTYEIAMPWSSIDEYGHEYASFDENENGAIDTVYGLSACVFNADGTSGARTWNAALSWGSGILNEQQTKYTSTCGGSNGVTLVADKVSADKAYNASFTQIPGGYVPPAANPQYAPEIDKTRLVGPLTYDSQDDMFIYGDQFDQMGGVWTTEPDGNKVVQWNEDTGDLFNSPTASHLNESNYLSSKGAAADTYSFDGQGNYTMEFDVMVTGTELFQANYPSTLYNWFGGSSTVEYECGYDFSLAKFIVRETETEKIIASVGADFSLNEWHHWVFQYFKDNSEMRFYFDPKMENGVVSKDADPLFRMSYRYFDMPGVEHNEVILRRLNCQIKLDNVKFYNFVDFKNDGVTPPNPTPTPDPGPTYQNFGIEVEVVARDDGTFEVKIPNNDKYKADNVTAVKFTIDLTKADGKLTVKGLEGVADGAIEVKDNEDGTYTLTVKDLKIFKDIEEGKKVFSVILQPAADEKFTVEDVKGSLSVKATITSRSSQTGDNAVAFIAAAVLVAALLGTGVVLYTRKRRQIDF